MNIIDKAKQYALECHRDTNHKYGSLPYSFHLEMVYREANNYLYLVKEEDKANFLAAAWCHDLIEDCRETYNDVKENTNKEVADLVYALTNEKGKTRSERANKKYYEEMKQVPNAVLLKVCDRIANVKFSIMQGSDMRRKYEKENHDFIFNLKSMFIVQPFDDLQELFRIKYPKDSIINFQRKK